MKTPVILEVPQEFNPVSGDLNEFENEFLDVAGLQFQGDIMPGTMVVDGRKLVLAMTSEPEILEEWANNEFPLKGIPEPGPGVRIVPPQAQGGWSKAYAALDLAMTRAHKLGEKINEATLLKYFEPVRTYDEDGEIVSEVPRETLKNAVPMWAGRKWEY